MADFITKKENQRRMIVVILCAVASAGALTACIFAVKKANDLENKPENPESIVKLRGALATQREANQKLVETLNAFGEPVGWRDPSIGTMGRRTPGPPNAEAIKKFLSDCVAPPPGKEDVSLLQRLGVANYRRWDDNAAGDKLHLTRLLEVLLEKEKEYKSKIGDLQVQIEAERKKDRETADAAEKDTQELSRQLVGDVQPNQPAGGLIGEFIKVQKDFNALQKSHEEEMGPLETDTVSKQHEATRVKNENVRKKAALEATRADLARRIYSLQHRREEARERREPDGEIMGVDSDLQLCYVNLLRKDRLFQGTAFTVYSLQSGGEKVDKARVEVTEVREEGTSVCAVLRTFNPEDPVKPGDRIYNEFFEAGRPRYIAFAGRLTGRLSEEEAARLIRDFGDHYQEATDEKTDYVVVAEGYENHPNFKAAMDYGIKILRERHLCEYLGVK